MLNILVFLYSLQPDGENLVILGDTSASAVLQKDGTVICTHELLSPIGLFHARLFKVKEPSTVLQRKKKEENWPTRLTKT